MAERGRGKERISLEALCSRCPDTFLQRGLVRQEKRHVSRHHVHTSSLRGHRYETRFLHLFLCITICLSLLHTLLHRSPPPVSPVSSLVLPFSLASSSSPSRLSHRRYQHTASQETHEDITLTISQPRGDAYRRPPSIKQLSPPPPSETRERCARACWVMLVSRGYAYTRRVNANERLGVNRNVVFLSYTRRLIKARAITRR